MLCNNNPITSVDNRGLATVRITTNDGNTQTYVNRPKKDIIDSISNTPNHSIVSIEITGHGSPSSIEMFDGGQGLVCIQDPTDPTNWTVCFTDDASSFSDLLKDKLACSATIDLDGCNTAWEGDIFIGKSFGCRSKAKQKSIVMPPDFQSIAETLSNELPDATVRGHSDYRMGIDSQRYFNLFRDIVFRDPDVSYKGGNKQ